MKKTIFVVTTVLFLVSCQKTNPKPQTSASLKEDPTPVTNANQKPQPHKTINACWSEYFHECWILVKCNCTILKEIIVNPRFTGKIRNATTPIEVAELFKDSEYAEIVNALPDDHLDSLRSGRYYISIGSESQTKICVFGGPVSPLTSQNMSFAFQYDK